MAGTSEFSYRANGEHEQTGAVWSLVIKNGKTYSFDGREFREVPSSYLDRQWFIDERGSWDVYDPPTTLRSLEALRYLATKLLPWWENEIHPNHSQKTRKGWSHNGAVTGVGDIGNRVYHATVQTALEMRRRLDLPPLWTIEGMNMESTGDVLEGMLGLAFMMSPILGDQVDAVRRNVEVAALSVLELCNRQQCWTFELEVHCEFVLGVDLEMTPPLTRREIVKRGMYASYVARVRARTAMALVARYRLGLPEATERVIRNFVFMESVGHPQHFWRVPYTDAPSIQAVRAPENGENGHRADA